MYDCKQLEDVSSVENVHMVTEILSQVLIRCYHLHLPSLSSVVPQAFGALKLKGRLYLNMTSYYYVHMKSLLLPILPCIQFHQQFLHGLRLDHRIIFVQQQLCAVCSEFRDKSLLDNN